MTQAIVLLTPPMVLATLDTLIEEAPDLTRKLYWVEMHQAYIEAQGTIMGHALLLETRLANGQPLDAGIRRLIAQQDAQCRQIIVEIEDEVRPHVVVTR